MKSYHIILIALVSLFATACTEVIEIEVDEADQRLVIEATLTNTPLNNQVVLTQSAGFYDIGTYPRISDAEVSVQDEQGNVFDFEESEPGIFTSTGFIGTLDQLYTLNVSFEGENYTAVSQLRTPVQIDSVEVEFQAATPFSEEGYIPTIYFSSDRPNSDTYARFLVIQNGELLNQYNLYNGNQPRGESGTIAFFDPETTFVSGDTLTILAASIDRAVYDYYFQLAEITGNGQGPAAAAPSNPTTNLSNDALGYFGALGISTTEIIIP